MMQLVIDTHALFWYLLGSPRLSVQARSAIEMAERGEARALIPAVVLAEMYYLNGKFKFIPDFDQKIAELRASGVFQFLPLEVDEVVSLGDPRFAAILEMHDRLIVIAAARLGASIVTRDRNIGASQVVAHIW